MLDFGPLAFAAPGVLAALVVVPVVWWLVRVTPPAPRRLVFPPIALLRDLVPREETPAHSPPWLIVLRLACVVLVIGALAGPVLNPEADLPGSGPVVLVIDTGWAAAERWPDRRAEADALITRAERQGWPVALLATAAGEDGAPPALDGPMPAAEARRRLDALAPQPWPKDLAATAAALDGFAPDRPIHAVWLADGLAAPGDPGASTTLAARLQRLGGIEVVTVPPDRLPVVIRPPRPDGRRLVADLVRAEAAAARSVTVRAIAGDGRLLGRETATFAVGVGRTTVGFDLPLELRNAVARLAIEGTGGVGGTALLDARWRRRPVGVVAGAGTADGARPLLGDLYYLERALAPIAEVRRGSLDALLDDPPAVLMLADVGALGAMFAARLAGFLGAGGVVVRFAGPTLAAAAGSAPLVPVPLRRGDRTLGGALSWSAPAPLASFDAASPFHGLAVPAEVTVGRQVLAEPTLELPDRTWARLADGTPLVTADRRGDGWLVLIHTTAGPAWSNLALSGLFVDMLERLVALSAGRPAAARPGRLAPHRVFDGFARLGAPGPAARPLEDGAVASAPFGPAHPPGVYGPPQARRARNLGDGIDSLAPLGALPSGVAVTTGTASAERPLKPWLLGLAFALVIVDLIAALALRGLFGRRGPAIAAALVGAIVIGGATARPATADDAAAVAAANRTWLAFVVTGDRRLDATTRAGLEGLAHVLNRRSAVEAAGARGVDIERDELAFFPLLYWAVAPDQPTPSPAARRRLNAYLANGGTILFDTRDQRTGSGALGRGPGGHALGRLTAGLEIPALAPVPPDHVLTKAFYLLREFPGRYAGGRLWVEADAERRRDGVSAVLIGANDWAGAWALDPSGRPLFPAVPGGERQRELAYRVGVNLVMYALTGNYKADQVHVPAILERLGQ